MTYTSRREMDLGAFEDDYRGFDMRDDDAARGPLILALALGVLLVFGAVVWNTYRQGVRPGSGDVPIIAAEVSQFKRAPDERGGYQGSDLNKRIYDQLDGSERDDPARLQSAAVGRDPGADERTLRLQGGPPMDLRGARDDRNETEAETQTETDGMAAPSAVIENAEALDDLAGSGEREVTRIAAFSPGRESAAPVSEPRLSVAYPGDEIAARAAAPAPNARFDSKGTFLVQIAALRSQDAAEQAWDQAVNASPSLFLGAEKQVQRADLGAKGVFYRLRVGAFATRDTASDFCESLKADGRQCIVVTQ